MAQTSRSIKAALNRIMVKKSPQIISPSSQVNSQLKSYQDIPRSKSLLPAQLALLLSGGPGHLHEHCDKRHKDLGPIYRERLGSNELVFIADTKMIRAVIANEGLMPQHNVPEAWLLYNQMRGIERGLFFELGESWLKLRRVFNKVMLAEPKKLTRFSKGLAEINRDLLESWASDKRNQLNEGFKIEDAKQELCKWSIEATGLTLFGERLGCVPPRSSPNHSIDFSRAEDLVKNVTEMFEQTSKFQIIPPRLAMRLNLNSWKRFVAASDDMIDIAHEFANEYLGQAKQRQAYGQAVGTSESSILEDILNMKVLDDDEISRSLVDLIIAGADTTSNALQWVLYSLAKHPDAQKKLNQEVETLKAESQQRQLTRGGPYCEAVIKETFRLYPTAPFLARTLDHTISLDGYEIAAGVPIVLSLFTTSRMSENFDQPLEFKPERWMRASDKCHETKANHDAFASLPFGIGSRMCIARRMAYLEMSLLISSMVESYELLPLNPKQEVIIKLKMVLGPDKPIGIHFKPRFR